MIQFQEQVEGQPKPPNAVEVHTDTRSSKIIKEVFLAHESEPFSKVSLAAVKSSADHGLPVTVNLCGNGEKGRISIVANAVCTMVSVELTDVDGSELPNMLAEIAKFDSEGKKIIEEDHKGTTVLQLSLNSDVILNLLGAILSANNPNFSHGCELIAGEYMIDPDGNDEDEDNTEPKDINHGGEVPTSEGEAPIPFPAQPEPAPAN